MDVANLAELVPAVAYSLTSAAKLSKACLVSVLVLLSNSAGTGLIPAVSRSTAAKLSLTFFIASPPFTFMSIEAE